MPYQQGGLWPASQSIYRAEWLSADGYLTRLGFNVGPLFVLYSDEGQVLVRGDGTGSVFIRQADESQLGPYNINEALQKLADLGYFGAETDAADQEMVTELSSATWAPGDVIAVVAPHYDASPGGGVEFAVDGIEMCTTGSGTANPQSPQDAGPLILTEKQWDLDGGGGSPGNDDSGTEVLIRIGPDYLLYQCSGGEYVADKINAANDEEAIRALHL